MEERLGDLRGRLLRLHALLLDRERRAYEAAHGPITSGAFLQLLIGDERFEWLRPLSRIITGIEEALEVDAPTAEVDRDTFFQRAHRLLRSGGPGAFETKYHAALQESPDVVMAHAEVVKMLPRRGP